MTVCSCGLEQAVIPTPDLPHHQLWQWRNLCARICDPHQERRVSTCNSGFYIFHLPSSTPSPPHPTLLPTPPSSLYLYSRSEKVLISSEPFFVVVAIENLANQSGIAPQLFIDVPSGVGIYGGVSVLLSSPL